MLLLMSLLSASQHILALLLVTLSAYPYDDGCTMLPVSSVPAILQKKFGSAEAQRNAWDEGITQYNYSIT